MTLRKSPHVIFPKSKFLPKPDEIIPVIDFPTIPSSNMKKLDESSKNKLNVKTIVSHRVLIYWSKSKRYFPGTVIGYTSSLTHNLILYDQRTVDTKTNVLIPPECDLYKEKLFPDGQGPTAKWILLG